VARVVSWANCASVFRLVADRGHAGVHLARAAQPVEPPCASAVPSVRGSRSPGRGPRSAFLAVASFDYRALHAWATCSTASASRAGHGADSRRWWWLAALVRLGAFHLQATELMKVLTIIALAKYVRNAALDGRTLRPHLVPIFLAAGCPFFIAAQPALGTRASSWC